ncbi:ATP-binding protein [Rubinisphaera margarita]|uniref:ATP-binding protein n=1 Tax=Rubinisphaera margarita TaxID=2909586 RepID=UPI001EE83E45|nr:ATP-binding protein [Rubinisphaera margarita]MCG6155846.1 ATP-binding protein [Rubinisphaera margarita]
MSYRTIKRLLGETSLERKCRFLFGGGLMLLISGSFYFYAQLNARIIENQNKETAQLLVAPIIMEKHMKAVDIDQEHIEKIEEMASFLKPVEIQDYRWRLLKSDPTADSPDRPTDDFGYEALARIRSGDSEYILTLPDRQEYRYYAAVKASKSCLTCHYHRKPNVAEGDLLGMVKITLPLTKTKSRLAKNNAILLAMAIVTSFLAMVAAYAIVRYVIVKPVLHLKDVSDEIARGTLDLRADIRTGDEFEELSHAFNRMLRHLVTVQDELKEANTNLDHKVDELARANLSLFEMNKLKNEFLATMSHELRTPLNSILGFSDVLGSASNLNDKQKRYLQNISTSGQRLLTLINDILDLAKIESGKMEIHPVKFSIAEIVEQLCLSISPLADRKNIELTWFCAPDVPQMNQDSGKIQQILTNLLSNAVKFTPEGGRVRVTATSICITGASSGSAPASQQDFVQVSVADTGIGIPLADQERIFEKFRQAEHVPGQDNLLTREYEGTGLGLSIVKELCKLLGGEVTVESEFGKGSTFIVRLPREVIAEMRRDDDNALEYQTIERTRSRVQQLVAQNDKESGGSARDAG